METTIQTKGMHCKSCEMLLIDTLEDAGAKSVKADHKSGKVIVEHDASLSLDTIKSLIKEEGHEVIEK